MAEWKSFGFDGSIIPIKGIEKLDKALTSVVKIIDLLMKIIKLLQMFISAFSSLGAILKAFISLVRGQLKKISDSLGSAGVFVNILVPPAFVKGIAENPLNAKFSTGGYDGFFNRFKVSLYNNADKNRPLFKKDGLVGGIIFLGDTENLDDFFAAMNFITSLFSFSDIFPFNTTPPPPINIRSSSGFFKQKDNTMKYGIKLEWDSPLMGPFTYRVSRSQQSGGLQEYKEVIPNRLVDLLKAFKIKLGGGDWPKQLVTKYEDFQKTVMPNPITGGASYIDYVTEDKQYFYIVESGFPPMLWGKPTPEIPVYASPTNCIPVNTQGVIENKKGIELVSIGASGGLAKSLGQWSSLQIKAIMPFLPPLLEAMDNFLKALEGNLVSNTKSFTAFLDGIVAKFKKYQAMLEAVVTMILALENFFSSAPKLAMLYVPVSTGGVDKFVEKVKGATPPPGGFSGKGGTTLGVVIMWGASINNPVAGVDVKSITEQVKLIGKAMDILSKIFK